MNANMTGLLWTAGAIVIGIVVATMVQKQISKKQATASVEDE